MAISSAHSHRLGDGDGSLHSRPDDREQRLAAHRRTGDVRRTRGARLVVSGFVGCLVLFAAEGFVPGEKLSSAPAHVGDREAAGERRLPGRLERLEQRMATVEAEGHALMTLHDRSVAPVAALLERRMAGDPATARRAALALVREGRAAGVDPRLLAAVLLVENPWLDPTARSPVGAVGLMQIMPFHAGRWGCDGDDLEHPETNICHGARILAAAIRRTRDLESALLRYNGCRYGTNTPDCHQYPLWVYGRAGPTWMAGIGADLPS